jgi:hypothetical protein
MALACVLAGPALAGCGVGCDSNLAGEESPTGRAAEAGRPQVSSAPLVTVAPDACKPLMAGQRIVAGEICARVDGDELVFRYRLTDGWELVETHLWAGTNLATMPRTRTGNPKPGQFPWGGAATGSTTEARVPLSTFGLTRASSTCADVLAVVGAHASIRKVLDDGAYQQETAWGDGTRLTEHGSWGMWYGLTLRCGPEGPDLVCGETAFARHSRLEHCFIGSPWVPRTSRWGWSNGPFSEGTHAFEVWAGAAGCVTERGALVGRAELRYGGGTAEVVLTAIPPFSFAATQLYVGSEPLPRNRGEFTVSPGLFPFQHTLSAATSDRFVVSGLSGPIHLVLHAETCRRGGWGDHDVMP